MNTVEVLRFFKNRLFVAIERKTSWGKNELEEEITKVYMEILEDMINPKETK